MKVNTKKEKAYILFFNACTFKEISFYLLNNANRISTDCNIFSGIVVNGMLAIELFLKFLICVDNASKNGKVSFEKTHYVDELFSNLGKKRQSEIREEMRKRRCDTKRFYRFRLQAQKARRLKESNKGKNGDVVNWRYLLIEGKNNYRFDINTMVKLVEVLFLLSRDEINKGKKLQLPTMSSFELDDEVANIVGQCRIIDFYE